MLFHYFFIWFPAIEFHSIRLTIASNHCPPNHNFIGFPFVWTWLHCTLTFPRLFLLLFLSFGLSIIADSWIEQSRQLRQQVTYISSPLFLPSHFLYLIYCIPLYSFWCYSVTPLYSHSNHLSITPSQVPSPSQFLFLLPLLLFTLFSFPLPFSFSIVSHSFQTC